MEFTFALLSGGASKRFGSDKTIALYKNKPLFLYGLETGLSVSKDVIHISKNPDKYKPFIENVKYLSDDLKEICPMSGLIKAGTSAKYDYIFVLSADSPLITKEFILFLSNNIDNYDGIVPEINGKIYPLISIYKKNVLLNMQNDYNKKNYKIIKSLENFNIKYLNENTILNNGFSKTIFTNINYTDDLKNLESKKWKVLLNLLSQ